MSLFKKEAVHTSHGAALFFRVEMRLPGARSGKPPHCWTLGPVLPKVPPSVAGRCGRRTELSAGGPHCSPSKTIT